MSDASGLPLYSGRSYEVEPSTAQGGAGKPWLRGILAMCVAAEALESCGGSAKIDNKSPIGHFASFMPQLGRFG